MFTGIIKYTSKVTNIKKDDNGMTLEVEKPNWDIKIGDSITIDGVCSTVKKLDANILFEYMPESLQKSNIGTIKNGMSVNMEQSLTLQDRLDGHIIQGHVDTTGVITNIKPEGNSFVFTIKVNNANEFMKYLAPKGSIAIDGISLTVVDIEPETFTVKILPYTMDETNLGTKKMQDTVNLEFDVLAKYIARLMPNQ